MATYDLSTLNSNNDLYFYLNASSENDIVTVADGDASNYTVRASSGDDQVILAGGYDTAIFAGSLYQKNDVTGELELMYEITQVDEDTIKVTDLYASVQGDDGSDTLVNVDRLKFEGDNTAIRVSAETWAWNFVRNDWNNITQSEFLRDVRMIRIEGGVFADVIYGEQGADSLEGRGGNDVIYADGLNASETPVARINFAGGEHWQQQVLNSDNVQETNLVFDAVTAGLRLVDVGVIGSNGGYTRTVTAQEMSEGVGAKVWISVLDNPDATAVDLGLYSDATLSDLLALEAALNASGGELQLWVVSTNGEKVLLALESDATLYSDDEIRGGAGNDFIDGGATRTAPENGYSWSGNRARYDGVRADYEVDQFTVSSDGLGATTTLLSGLTFAEYFESIGSAERPVSLAAALAVWEVNPDLLELGETYTLVTDKVTNRDGTDILVNIDTLEFSDGGTNLTVKVEPRHWSDLPGNNYQGSIVNDVIVGSDDYDSLSGREGNDLLLAGDSGDWVEGNSGNDFADGGANGTGSNNWENRDRFQLSGDLKRYTVEEISGSGVADFLTANFDSGDLLANSVVYNPDQTYFLITDKSPFGITASNPYGGEGQDLITGFEVIQFSDTHLDLVADVNWYAKQWENAAELGVRGTIFADTIDATIELAERQTQFDAEVGGQLKAGYSVSTWGDLGAGDDVYFGAVSGDRIALGSGDDLYVGGGNQYLEDHRWLGRDEVRFNGDFERFELTKLTASQSYTFKDGNADVVVDLSDIANLRIAFKGTTYTLDKAPSSILVVQDRLPSSLGGEGVDIVIDAFALNFDDRWLPIEAEENFHTQTIDNPDLSSTEARIDVMRAHVRAGYFGGELDLTEGLLTDDGDGNEVTVVRGHINTSNGNDDILGFKEENFVSIQGGGNDFFNAVSDYKEARGSGIDAGSPWEYYDRVEFSGAYDQYKVSETYVAVDTNNFAKRDANTDAILDSSVETAEFATKAIKVESLRDPSDIVYLVGVEEVRFSGGEEQYRFGVVYEQWNSTLDLDDNVASRFGLESRKVESGGAVSAWKGSVFDDVLVGREAPDYYSLGDKDLGSPYFEVELPQSWTALFLGKLRDGFLLAYDDTDSDGYLEIVDGSGRLDPADIQFFLYMDSAERQQALLDGIAALGGATPDSAEAAAKIMYDAFVGNSGNWSNDWDFIDGAPFVGKVANSSVILPATMNYTPEDLDQNISASVEFFSRVDTGQDALRGNGGDDALFGLGGGDTFQGGAGNDIFYGGDEPLGSIIALNQAPWAHANTDKAEYEGEFSRYTLTQTYVKVDGQGLAVKDASGNVITSTTSLAGYEQVWTVTDSVPDSAGGSGTDYLFDIERVSFFGDNRNLWLEDSSKFELSGWHPNTGWALPADTTILSIGIHDRVYGGSTIDLNALWSQAPSGYGQTFTSWTGYDFTIEGFANVRASDGYDVIYGLISDTANPATQYYVRAGLSTDYTFAQGTDERGDFVTLSLKEGVEKAGLLQEAKLYDVDYIWWEEEQRQTLIQTAEHDHFGLFVGTGTHLDGTIFDDLISSEAVNASVNPDYSNFATVWVDEGNDKTYGQGSHTLYQEGRGNDFFDGGSGVDVVDMYNTNLNQLAIQYFKDSETGQVGVFDETDILLTLAEFQAQGIKSYWSDSSVAWDPSTSIEVTKDEFLANYTAQQLVTLPEGQSLMDVGLGGSGTGWVTYNDGYYISVRDSSGDVGSGSDVYRDIEAINFQETLIDVVTGVAYSGQIIPYPWRPTPADIGAVKTEDFQTLIGQQDEDTTTVIYKPFRFETDFANTEVLDTFRAYYDYGGAGSSIALLYEDVAGDSVYYGSSGVVGISGELESVMVAELRNTNSDQTNTIADALEASQEPINYNFVDVFVDGLGDDIYVGNGLFNLIPNGNQYRYMDQLGLNAPISRYEIISGVLTENGSINSAHSLNTTLLSFADAALAGERYLIVKDTLPDADGGTGENLAIGIDMVSSNADQKGYWYGTQTRLSGSRLELTQYGGLWDVNVQTDEYLLDRHDQQAFKSVEIRAWEGDSLYVGFDAPVYDRDWDYLDKVRFDTLSADDFEVTSVWLAQTADARFVKGADGQPREYASAELAGQVGTAKLGYKFDGSAVGAGVKYAVDIEKAIFAGDYQFDLGTTFRFEDRTHQDWDVRIKNDDGSIEYVPSFSTVEIYLSDIDGYFDPSESDWLSLVAQSPVQVGSPLYVVDRIRDGSGDDTIVLNTKDFGSRVQLTSGDDFVHFMDPSNPNFLHLNSWVKDDSVRIEIREESSRFDISQIYIKLLAEDSPERRADGTIREFSADEAGVTRAIKLQDIGLRSTADGYLGTKIIVGVERIEFSDTSYDVQVHAWEEDWDNDGVMERYGQGGSDQGETIVGDWGADSTRDRIEGRGGDDILIGGANGDELRGGSGNDLLIGGSNGSSGNYWDDQDRADYWPLTANDLLVSQIRVAFNASTNEVVRDSRGNIITAADEYDLRSGFVLTDAIQVTDLTGAFGTDVLIGVELINTSGGEIRTSVSFQNEDWDNDGEINQVRVRGTDFDDVIGGASADANVLSALDFENGIETGDGDDVIYAGRGGDWIRPGSGVDFVDGGLNGKIRNDGWTPKDSVQFSGEYERYLLTNYTFNAEALDVLNAEGAVVFSIDSDGNVVNAAAPNVLLTTLTLGTAFITVEDKLPNFDYINGDGFNFLLNVENLSFSDRWLSVAVERNVAFDDQGNPAHGWMNGTLGNDTIKGSSVDDWIAGSDGDDVLIGLEGNDNFSGGAGNDLIYGDKQGQILGDRDSVRYDGDYAQFSIVKKISTVAGFVTPQTVVLVTDLLPNELGGSGTDTLVGIESLSFNDKWLRVGVESWNQYDTDGELISTHFRGSDFNDVVKGTINGDEIWDQGGSDTLYGFDGADRFHIGFGDDTVYGGAEGLTPWGQEGVDEAIFIGSVSQYDVTYWDASGGLSSTYDPDGYIQVADNRTAAEGGYGTNILYGVERLSFDDQSINLVGINNGTYIVGSDSDDLELKGSWGPSVDYRIEGNAGDDVLRGQNGDDLLEGGEGNDTLYGEIGADVAVFSGKLDDFIVSGNADQAVVTAVGESASLGTDTLYSVEQLRFDDATLNLKAGYFVRDLDKNGSFETAIYTGFYDGNNQTDSDFKAQIRSKVSSLDTDTFANSTLNYRVTLSNKNDSFVLGNGENSVVWSKGIDSLTGGTGTDTLIVNDSYYDAAGMEKSWEILAGGIAGTVTLADGVNTTTLTQFDVIEFSDQVFALVEDIVTLDTNGDGVFDSGSLVAAYTGTSFNPDGYSSNIDWELKGGNGVDNLTGGSGDDVFVGSRGNDILNGGEGYDIIRYVGSRMDFEVNPVDGKPGEWIVEGLLTGSDTLANVEAIQFSDKLERLEVLSELNEVFVFGQGRIEQMSVRGTGYADTLDVTGLGSQLQAVEVVATGGGGIDRFVVDIADLNSTKILDFTTDEDWLEIVGTGQDYASVDDLLESAETISDGDSVIFSFAGNEIILLGTEVADLSSENIKLLDLDLV